MPRQRDGSPARSRPRRRHSTRTAHGGTANPARGTRVPGVSWRTNGTARNGTRQRHGHSCARREPVRGTGRCRASEYGGGHEVGAYEGDEHGQFGPTAGDSHRLSRTAPILCVRSDRMQYMCVWAAGTPRRCAAGTGFRCVCARPIFWHQHDTPEPSAAVAAAHTSGSSSPHVSPV